jgi:AcrR family transcriptional regulator
MGIKERRERERSERRDAILQAAVKVYMEEGYHATTMDKIAETAELSRATLYLYFTTKDEIFVQAIVRQSEYFAELLEGIYKRRESVGETLLPELWEGFKEFYSMDPALTSVTLYFHQSQMLRNLSDPLRSELDRTGSQNYFWLCKLIKHGIRKGLFRKCNEKTLAEFIWTSFLGILHLENSKTAMGRKTHLEETWVLGLSILEKGLRPEA